MDIWVEAIIQALINCLKNPLLYWALLLSIYIVAFVRNQEKFYFRKALLKRHTLWLQMNKFTPLGSILISLIAITFGLVINYEIVVILTVVTLILSIGFKMKFLSSTYTLGFTYFLMLPTLLNFFNNEANSILVSITLLVSIFLFIEAYQLQRTKVKKLNPEVIYSKRGHLIGQYSLERLFFTPFFIFVPEGDLTPFLLTLPFGDSSYHLAFIPFVFGFHYQMNNNYPQIVMNKIKKQTIILATIALLGTIISIFVPYVTYITMGIAFIGYLYIQSANTVDQSRAPYLFLSLQQEAKVFWVKKDSIAERFGFNIGDLIKEVNGQTIHTVDELNFVLNQEEVNHATFTIITYQGEEKQIQIDEQINHAYHLGLIFIK